MFDTEQHILHIIKSVVKLLQSCEIKVKMERQSSDSELALYRSLTAVVFESTASKKQACRRTADGGREQKPGRSWPGPYITRIKSLFLILH